MSAYLKLTKKQKEFFDVYVKNRSIYKTAKELNISEGNADQIFKSVRVMEALEEYNKELKDKTQYNEAVIIDELWKLYNDPDATIKDKRETLIWLGKHINMWSNLSNKKDSTPNIQYNIVNYNQIEHEVKENQQLIEDNSEVVEAEFTNGFDIKKFA